MNHIDQFRQNEKKLSAILFQLLSLPFLALPYALCSMRLYLPRLKAGEHHAVAEMAAADSKKASCLTLISIAGLERPLDEILLGYICPVKTRTLFPQDFISLLGTRESIFRQKASKYEKIEGVEGGRKMKRKTIAAFAILFLMMGYIALAEAQEKPGAAPVITQAFAAKEIRPGETWKIYLNASDPNGDMKNIFAVVYQPGVGPYPASLIRVKEQNQKELSGYIYLWTSTPWHPMDYVNLSVTVQIQDKTGNFSEPAVFVLSLTPRGSQEAPPQGVFKEQELGPIMVKLKTIDGGDGGGGESGGH